MLDKRLLLDNFLLDGYGELLFDLGFDHFDEELLSSFVEWNRLRLRLLAHQLLILDRELLDLGLILFILCGQLGDSRGQAGEHGAQLQAILSEFALFLGHWRGLLLDAHSAVVLHGDVCHKAAIYVRVRTWISLLLRQLQVLLLLLWHLLLLLVHNGSYGCGSDVICGCLLQLNWLLAWLRLNRRYAGDVRGEPHNVGVRIC